MAENFIAITQGSGTKLHTFDRTYGGNTVHEEVQQIGEPVLPAYTVATASAVSCATGSAHLLAIQAGGSLNLYIRHIRIFQNAMATSAVLTNFSLFRLTTAGSGGSVATPVALDPGDPSAGASTQALPTTKGTEGALHKLVTTACAQTVPTNGGGPTLLAEWDFEKPHTKALKVPAGTANGVAVKLGPGVAGMTVLIEVDFSEGPY